MNTHRCKTPSCEHVIYGGSVLCSACRQVVRNKVVRNKRQGAYWRKKRERKPLDLSAVKPEHAKYLARLFEVQR